MKFKIQKEFTARDMAIEFVSDAKNLWPVPLIHSNEEEFINALEKLIEKAVSYANQTQNINMGEDRRS